MGAGDSATRWLLASPEPGVRYLTRVDVLGESPRSAAVRRERAAIPRGPWVRALLSGQRANGGFGVHPYSKWTGAHWRLVSLVELAVPEEHPGARAAAEHVLAWIDPAVLPPPPVIAGRTRMCASIRGNALAVASRLGFAEDPRAERLATLLAETQWPDGGWNCDKRPRATHSSFHESLATLWGLTEYARAAGDRAARTAARRAAESFLRHRLFRSERTREVGDPEWLRLHYPPYWHHDILQALLVLSRAGLARDPRCRDALDILEGKRLPDGTWQPDNCWWRPGRKPQLGKRPIEVVDWGRHGPNPMITLNTLRVLRAAGRLR